MRISIPIKATKNALFFYFMGFFLSNCNFNNARLQCDEYSPKQNSESFNNVLLTAAGSKDDLSKIKFLLQGSVDVNATDDEGNTPLHLAVFSSGDKALVKLLIDAKANIHAQNNEGFTPLHVAVYNGNKAAVKLLLEARVNPNLKDNKGRVPSAIACEKGVKELLVAYEHDIENLKCLVKEAMKGSSIKFQKLLQQYPEMDTCYEDELWTQAIDLAKLPVMKELIKHKANVNLNMDSGTPLHRAVLKDKNISVATFLLEAKADIYAKNSDGKTPLALAEGQANKSSSKPASDNSLVIALLKEHKSHLDDLNKQLELAVDIGNLTKMKSLIEMGASVNSHSEYDYPILHTAARYGDLEALKLLLESKADILVKEDDHTIAFSVLHAAADQGHKGAAEELLRSKADIHVKDWSNRTPLHFASRRGYKGVVRALLDAKADIYAEDKKGNTPLALARKHGRKETEDILFKYQQNLEELKKLHNTLRKAAQKGNLEKIQQVFLEGADVDDQDEDGKTALHWAAQKGHMKVIEILMKENAAVNLQDKGGKTALQRAIENGHKEVTALLMEAQADVSLEDKAGKSALKIAKRNNVQGIIKLLSNQ